MNEVVRKIIHIDMDAFFASVEQRDNPELRGVPLVVGGYGRRGVIAAASYEARKYGVYSAMPSRVALRKYPLLKFVKPNFSKYQSVSAEIRNIFHRYTDIVEPLSLDEAFLDVTYSSYETRSATLIAQQIKNDIRNELDLIASAGVSYNKFLAKTASDQDKPDGLFIITPEQGPEFVQSLPIEKFFGVGKVTAEKMKANHIFTGKDLLTYSKMELHHLFGKMGGFLFDIARGIDEREVKHKSVRKSIGVEITFSENISDRISIDEQFNQIFEKWWERYEGHGYKGRTVTLKIRDNNFNTSTRSFTETHYLSDKNATRKILSTLLNQVLTESFSLRLMGVSITNIENSEQDNGAKQLTIW